MKPTFFRTPLHFRRWLEKNHGKRSELLVGYYRKSTGKPSITWEESVEQALCFGWIDGIRKSLGDESYAIRFTPRKLSSNWSAVNIRLVGKLKKAGLMTKAGLDIFNARRTDHANYSYEHGKVTPLSRELEARFRRNKEAWKYFQSQPPSYRNPCTRWVMTGKQESTRDKRLEVLLASSAKSEWVPAMRWGKKK